MSPRVTVLLDESRRAHDGGGPRPVRIYEWRAARDSAPLVVLSHGTGGSALDLSWWAEPLCEAGFDVVGLDHHGNSHVDGYVAEAFVWWWDRPLDLSFVLDHVAPRGPVGACGFSIGGYTAAAVCGARVSAEAYRAMLTGAVEAAPTPEYPGLADEIVARYGSLPDRQEVARAWVSKAAADYRDPRVRAGFLLCPLGAPVDVDSLAAVDVPVAVSWTANDQSLPAPQNALRYARHVPGAEGGVVGSADSGHYGFVLPDQDDPKAKADVVDASVEFFTRTLAR
ncbi:alpha/beta hydrolase family protein [Promicromonospora iranensis]|uniref:Dienelactone hydrolase n=1 Tax=Promicromonospora iranensis TaxID=1105144 RepID=A0ABU2CKR9_9MICO|nr:alpha/beta hydrolase [Promicromonospora iranensis]MDR7381938.1 putative dienelactone hydrolase [Promicromonospora iranensis]